MKNNSLKRIRPEVGPRVLSVLAAAVAMHAGNVFAQAASVSPTRNIEDSVRQFQSGTLRFQAAQPEAQIDLGEVRAIDKLLSVEVDDAELSPDVQAYWADHLGQAVPADAVRHFKGWLFEQARRSGYLSYVLTDVVPGEQGSHLRVRVVRPRINAVRINAASAELAQRYGQLTVERLRPYLVSGDPLDTLGLDQRMDTAGFDLPIELDSTVRAAGRNQVDLILNMNPAPLRRGERLDALVQLNNYGLKSYGRPQVLASVTLGGWTPKSKLSVIAQGSQGVAFGRAEYDFAHEKTRGHVRVWGSASDSHSILGGSVATQSTSRELGFGHRSQVTGGYRDFVFQESADLVLRQTQTHLASTGALTSEVNDVQMRFSQSMDNTKLTTDATRAEFTVAMGGYGTLVNQNVEPLYAKLEMDWRHQETLDIARQWFAVMRVRGQYNTGRLDSGNQMALGGMDGVRAYTSVDGVGDRGLLLNLEVNRRLRGGMSLGAFYDVGSIRLMAPNPGTEYADRYALQAVGVQWSANIAHWFMNATLAKAIGDYRGWSPYNIESKPNNWRAYGSATYRF